MINVYVKHFGLLMLLRFTCCICIILRFKFRSSIRIIARAVCLNNIQKWSPITHTSTHTVWTALYAMHFSPWLSHIQKLHNILFIRSHYIMYLCIYLLRISPYPFIINPILGTHILAGRKSESKANEPQCVDKIWHRTFYVLHSSSSKRMRTNKQ